MEDLFNPLPSSPEEYIQRMEARDAETCMALIMELKKLLLEHVELGLTEDPVERACREVYDGICQLKLLAKEPGHYQCLDWLLYLAPLDRIAESQAGYRIVTAEGSEDSDDVPRGLVKRIQVMLADGSRRNIDREILYDCLFHDFEPGGLMVNEILDLLLDASTGCSPVTRQLWLEANEMWVRRGKITKEVIDLLSLAIVALEKDTARLKGRPGKDITPSDGTHRDDCRFLKELTEMLLRDYGEQLNLKGINDTVQWIFSPHKAEDPHLKECGWADGIRRKNGPPLAIRTMYQYVLNARSCHE